MARLKRLMIVGSIAVLAYFALYVVSTPFLREPPVPVVNVTIEPEPLDGDHQPPADHDATGDEATSEPVTTTPAHQIGERAGEQLNHLWQQTKEFGTGLWSGLTTEKES